LVAHACYKKERMFFFLFLIFRVLNIFYLFSYTFTFADISQKIKKNSQVFERDK